jgi:hypothetical protein
MEFISNYGPAIVAIVGLITSIILFMAYDKLSDEAAVAENEADGTEDADADSFSFSKPKSLVITGLIMTIVITLLAVAMMIYGGE